MTIADLDCKENAMRLHYSAEDEQFTSGLKEERHPAQAEPSQEMLLDADGELAGRYLARTP